MRFAIAHQHPTVAVGWALPTLQKQQVAWVDLAKPGMLIRRDLEPVPHKEMDAEPGLIFYMQTRQGEDINAIKLILTSCLL